MGAAVLQVFVLRDGQMSKSELFSEGMYTLGHDPDCDLVLEDPGVGGVHALLQFQDGAATITENDGELGIVVNGQRVNSAPLRPADDVRVGPFTIKVRVLGKKPGISKPATSAPPPAAQVSQPPAPSLGESAAPLAASPAPSPAPAQSAPSAPRPAVTTPPKAPPAAPRAAPQSAPPPLPRPGVPVPPPRPPAPPPPAARAPMPPPARPSSPAVALVPPQPQPVMPARPQLRAVPDSPMQGVQIVPDDDADLDAFLDAALAAEEAEEKSLSAPDPARAPLPAPGTPAPMIQARVTPTQNAPLRPPPPPPAPPPQARMPAPVAKAPPAPAPAAPPIRPQPPAPIAQGPAPMPQAPAPAPIAPPPQVRAPAPAAPAPIAQAPSPVAQAPAPVAQAPAPIAQPQAPVAQAPVAAPAAAPIARTPAAAPAPAAPAPMAAAPVPAAPAAPAPSAAQAVTPAPATRATPSATGLQKVAAPAALPGAMLHAQLYWGDTLLLARSFAAARPVFGEHADFELLALHGFTPNPGTSLIAPAGAAWNIAPPTGVEAFEKSGHGWAPAQAAASKELKLSSGGALRLTSGRFHLDLVAQKAPTQVGGGFGKTLDWTLGALLVTLTVLLVVGVRSLPPMPKVQPLEREAVRHVQMQIEEKKPEKPKKPKPVEVQKEQPKPQSIQQATTLKQAGMPLKSLDKIAKATKGISNLLAALNSSNKGGPKNNLPLLPSLGQAPAPLPSLGGIGPGGPITKGNELLRGGNLGALNGVTAGKGAVAGVPVSVPSKPSKVQGSIDRDAVAKVINDHVNDMRGCWERALIHDPNIAPGKVLLEWTIGAEGDVTQVGTKSVTLKSNEVVSCLLNVLRELKFPKPNGGVVIISYPVLFNSVGY